MSRVKFQFCRTPCVFEKEKCHKQSGILVGGQRNTEYISGDYKRSQTVCQTFLFSNFFQLLTVGEKILNFLSFQTRQPCILSSLSSSTPSIDTRKKKSMLQRSPSYKFKIQFRRSFQIKGVASSNKRAPFLHYTK